MRVGRQGLSHLFESKVGLSGARAALLVVALLLLVPASAEAREPKITDIPDIEGTAQVGQTLNAADYAWSDEPSRRPDRVEWSWWRCDEPGPDGDDDDDWEEYLDNECREIDGAESTSYTVREADRGRYLRVMLFLTRFDDDNGDFDSAWALSAPTSRVTAAPPPPPPPDPDPSDPGPSDPGPSDPGPSQPGPSDPGPLTPAAPQPGPVPAEGDTGGVKFDSTVNTATMMSPRALVRIRGRLTRRGARITLLTVRAPRGARITVRCQGRGCPARRRASATKLTRLTRYQRHLRAGTKLVILVTKRGRIGKHTTIKIRRGKAPWRSDRCLYPGTSRPTRCPRV